VPGELEEDENVITHEEVLAAANEAEPKMTALFSELVGGID
jgi:purine-nucleoside phosphorylase